MTKKIHGGVVYLQGVIASIIRQHDKEKDTKETKETLLTANRIVAVSGGFDPVHIGHLRMFQQARLLGDKLVVILNNDAWLKRKKGKAFMTQDERAEIIRGFACVDDVYIIQNKKEDHVVTGLRMVQPDIFANGGDRKDENDIPEYAHCEANGIRMVFGVGGGKIQSSSDLIKNSKSNKGPGRYNKKISH